MDAVPRARDAQVRNGRQPASPLDDDHSRIAHIETGSSDIPSPEFELSRVVIKHRSNHLRRRLLPRRLGNAEEQHDIVALFRCGRIEHANDSEVGT